MTYDIEAICDPEANEIPHAPLPSFWFNRLKIMIDQKKLCIRKTWFILCSDLLAKPAEPRARVLAHGQVSIIEERENDNEMTDRSFLNRRTRTYSMTICTSVADMNLDKKNFDPLLIRIPSEGDRALCYNTSKSKGQILNGHTTLLPPWGKRRGGCRCLAIDVKEGLAVCIYRSRTINCQPFF